MRPLQRFAADVGAPLLVLHDDASIGRLEAREDGWAVHPITGPLPDPQRWAGVAVVVADRQALRSAVSALPRLGRTRSLACVLTDEDHPAPVLPQPDWPPVTRLHARPVPTGGALTVLHLDEPMSVQALLGALASAAGSSRAAPRRIVLASDAHRHRHTLPPEVVVRPDDDSPTPSYDPAAAPAPAVVTDPVLGRGPLDEGIFNPIGFHSEPGHGVTDLDGAAQVSARAVATLRDHTAARVDWSDPTPELARSVVCLAMAGIPVVGTPPPAAARPWLGDELADALAADADVSDLLRREEHSIRLRRAALLLHAVRGWQFRAASVAGRPVSRFPTCSVVLATRRPDLLDIAVGNVARQRGVEVELVVAAHGFDPDSQRVRDLHPGPVEVVALPSETVFGNVLNAGVTASSGQIVVKMDDDDYYGPHFLLDLLLAREYSGADVVGTPAEFVYLEDLDLTLRRHGTPRDASERFAGLVAGGTISISRGLLDEAGGFQPVHRFVDHQLFNSTQALGATTYRSHGLGFMLRRSSGGHTWGVGGDHFLDPTRLHQQWPGYAPTRILEPDPSETT